MGSRYLSAPRYPTIFAKTVSKFMINCVDGVDRNFQLCYILITNNLQEGFDGRNSI